MISDDDKKRIEEGGLQYFWGNGNRPLSSLAYNAGATAEHLHMAAIVADRDRTIEEKDRQINKFIESRKRDEEHRQNLITTITALRERVAKLEEELKKYRDEESQRGIRDTRNDEY